MDERTAGYDSEGIAVAQEVADAILYEGYLLYPYRRSSPKNRIRWQFGVLLPPAWAKAHGLVDESVAGSAESWWQRTECLLESSDAAHLRCRIRFLQLERRSVQERTADGDYREVDSLETESGRELTFDGAVSQDTDLEFAISDLLAGPQEFAVAAEGTEKISPLGQGRVERRRWPVTAVARISATEAAKRLYRLRIQIENTDRTTEPTASRDEALRRSLIATHTLLAVDEGAFVSLLDPSDRAFDAANECSNIHTFPVLAGMAESRRVLLSSPIILDDHPRIAPESPGDLHDAAEIDEILTLRTLTLTDQEKREARATDDRAAAILDRVDTMPTDTLARLHGTVRSLRPAGDATSVIINGVPLRQGDRVRLRPRRRGTDPQDAFLHGRTALVEAVLTDVDGARHLAVTVEDDPAADLNRWYGRFRYFAPEEVEPL